MKNTVFGDIVFNTGWKTKGNIIFFGENFNITIKAKAYFESDAITTAQEIAFSSFTANKSEQMKIVEKLLIDFAGDNPSKRFVPRTLLFQRDGGYALLLDDKEDEDGGVAVSLVPVEAVLSQDEYL